MGTNGPPEWFVLIEGNKRRPSLLFVIGALRESGILASDGEDFEQFYGLLRDMASYEIGRRGSSDAYHRVVYVRLCPDLRVPVLSIWNEELTRMCGARYPSPEQGNVHLCFATEVEAERGLDLREVARRVFERYEHRSARDVVEVLLQRSVASGLANLQRR